MQSGASIRCCEGRLEIFLRMGWEPKLHLSFSSLASDLRAYSVENMVLAMKMSLLSHRDSTSEENESIT